ncbi:MAG: ATP-binding protein [Candidatus Woesearchaeota archaeon]
MAQLLEVLEKLNPWWQERPFETGITRDAYLHKISKYLKTKEILVVTGVRRSGKTVLLYQTIRDLISNQGIEPKRILFVNFDEPDLGELKDPIRNVLDVYFREVCSEPAYLVFDEVQNVPGWEKWAKSIYDEKKHQLIVSGSSSHLLDSKLATLLSGRYLAIPVFPLNFREYLLFNNVLIKDKLSLIANKNKIMNCLKKYLIEGGLPRIALQKEESLKTELLKTYHESLVYKDLVAQYNIRNVKVLKELIHYLYTTFTSSYSYKKISELLKIDFTTLKEYFHYLEEAKILFETSLFSYSLKVQSRNNKKIYCIDNGLRNAVSFKFSKDEGKLAENLVFVELKRREKEPYYWKNKGEIDFITKDADNSLTAINISYSDEIDEREIKSLLEFKKEFKKTKELILLTKDTEKQEKGIKFKPLWKWLLE